ncbi:right-handed parallel beta-helix repeat-containing protein [Streptacidiphilus rugosus]|uniref:hypothetical protein n=1 Tax=Streptacidiphilus rugosus TaxID=405783 RepID=UPI000B2FB09B|nr:hypothetical protein [Streptacidiphilus rugosus]
MPGTRRAAAPTPPDRSGRRRTAVRLLLAALALVAGLLVADALGAHLDERSTAGCPTGSPSACRTGSSADGASGPSGSGTRTATGSATPTATTSGSSSASASRSPSATAGAPATTSGGHTGPCSSPGACGFPSAATTGPRGTPGSRHSGDITVRTDGAVIDGWNLTGSLDIYANDVTVVDSSITSSNWWGVNLRSGYHGLRVLHSRITGVPGKGQDNGGEDYAVSNMGTSSVEVGWSDISVFGNALSMGQGNLHDNYVHDLAPFVNASGQWQHLDAVISDGGGSGLLVIRHNTLLNAAGVDRGASAAIGLYPDTGTVNNAVVDGNWIAGGSYALYGGGPGSTGVKVTNNVFSDMYHPSCGYYGNVAYWNAGGAGNVWAANTTSDGKPVTPQ